jgi:hypothetical protein
VSRFLDAWRKLSRPRRPNLDIVPSAPARSPYPEPACQPPAPEWKQQNPTHWIYVSHAGEVLVEIQPTGVSLWMFSSRTLGERKFISFEAAKDYAEAFYSMPKLKPYTVSKA